MTVWFQKIMMMGMKDITGNRLSTICQKCIYYIIEKTGLDTKIT